MSISVEPGTFDRIQYICPTCGQPAPITAVYLSLTRVGVEAECTPCRTVSARMFDLLHVDAWLRNAK